MPVRATARERTGGETYMVDVELLPTPWNSSTAYAPACEEYVPLRERHTGTQLEMWQETRPYTSSYCANSLW